MAFRSMELTGPLRPPVLAPRAGIRPVVLILEGLEWEQADIPYFGFLVLPSALKIYRANACFSVKVIFN